MPTPLQEEAARELESWENWLKYSAIASKVFFGVLGTAVSCAIGQPWGSAYAWAATGLVNTVPPEFEEYFKELKKVIRGERFTMPKCPDYKHTR